MPPGTGPAPIALPPAALPRRALARLVAAGIVLFARLVTAVRGIWAGAAPDAAPRVYFANHSSHGDFVLLWTVLPPRLRARTRPVAARDYWLASALRRFVGRDVFGAVLVDRGGRRDGGDPIDAMIGALDAGDALILFPEGTRNAGDAPLLPFRSGLHRLAAARPDVPLVPVWIDNLNRVLPKGERVPIPLVCTVTFGEPLRLGADEPKDVFLARAARTLLALSPAAGEGASDGVGDGAGEAGTGVSSSDAGTAR